MMKQDVARHDECPVRCPVCSHAGAPYPARFDRHTLMPGESIVRLSNKANLILFLIDGSLAIQIDNNVRDLHAGQTIFLGRNTHFQVTALQIAGIMWLEFSNRIILGERDVLSIRSPQPAVKEEEYPILDLKEPLLSRLRQMCLFNSPCYHLNLEYELYILMKKLYADEEIMRFFRPILMANENFQAFVIDNYGYGDTLKSIAQKANMSRTHFLRKFKAEFGMTAHQWLVKQKKQKLRQAIAAGQDDSKSLAAHFGFNSPVGLYLFCRRHMGKSLRQLFREAAAEHEQKTQHIINGTFCVKKDKFR